MSYGYNNEAEMRQYNPQIADILIKTAKSKAINVCSGGKQCVGCIEGEYWYSDGSKDFGREVIEYRSEYKGNAFRW